MADIAASDVTYSIIEESLLEDSFRKSIASIAFGDGALTYPTGGVPLTKAKLGMPNHLRSIKMVDPANANGFLYKLDLTNEKIRIYQGDNDNAADAPLIELVGGAATPAAATLKIEAEGY